MDMGGLELSFITHENIFIKVLHSYLLFDILLVRALNNKEEVMNQTIGEVELSRCDDKFYETFSDAINIDPIALEVWREAWRVRTDDILNQLETKIRLARMNHEAD